MKKVGLISEESHFYCNDVDCQTWASYLTVEIWFGKLLSSGHFNSEHFPLSICPLNYFLKVQTLSCYHLKTSTKRSHCTVKLMEENKSWKNVFFRDVLFQKYAYVKDKVIFNCIDIDCQTWASYLHLEISIKLLSPSICSVIF